MNKEQSADDPHGIAIHYQKYCLIAPFLSCPDVVIACIEHKVSLENIQTIEAALVKHDNNMKDYSLVVDQSP